MSNSIDRNYMLNNYGACASNKHLIPIILKIFLEPNHIPSSNSSFSCKAMECLYAVFIRNSIALFNLCSQSLYFTQAISSLRYIIEISADLDYISKHSKNINDFKKTFNKHKNKNVEQFTDVSEFFNKFRIHNEAGKNTITTERIAECLGEDVGKEYETLCGFTHVNYAGALMDLNMSKREDLQSYLFLAPLLERYPLYFRTVIEAASRIEGFEYDGRYDKEIDDGFEKTTKLIRKLLSRDFIISNNKSKEKNKIFNLDYLGGARSNKIH